MRSWVVAVAVCALVAPQGFARMGPSPQESEVKIGTTEVSLDIVAKDKDGHPVTGLKASDFTVLEDGVPQDVTSFRFVKPEAQSKKGAATPDTQTAGANAPDWKGLTTAPEDMKAIALVFDRLDPEARSLAHKAATQYVEHNIRQGDAVGVFQVDLKLESLLPY